MFSSERRKLRWEDWPPAEVACSLHAVPASSRGRGVVEAQGSKVCCSTFLSFWSGRRFTFAYANDASAKL